jgi:hypothetical protein
MGGKIMMIVDWGYRRRGWEEKMWRRADED